MTSAVSVQTLSADILLVPTWFLGNFWTEIILRRPCSLSQFQFLHLKVLLWPYCDAQAFSDLENWSVEDFVWRPQCQSLCVREKERRSICVYVWGCEVETLTLRYGINESWARKCFIKWADSATCVQASDKPNNNNPRMFTFSVCFYVGFITYFCVDLFSLSVSLFHSLNYFTQSRGTVIKVFFQFQSIFRLK